MAQLRVTGKSLPEHNRLHNRSLLLQMLFHDGPMSRADLARGSGLTRVTVSDLVNDLSADGLILELGQRIDSRVGKPAQLIGLDESSYHIVSLDLSADDRFVGAIVTLGGRIVHRTERRLDDATGQAAVEKAVELARDLVKRSTVRVLGIGIGTPGIVGHDGIVRQAPNLDWTDLDLGTLFRATFGLPVHVSNDANAGALAIHTFRRMRGQSFMLVAIEHGVGAGLIIGGALVEGDQFTAGEIGHLTVDENGERCTCGRNGCLEVAAAVPHLRRRLRDAPDPAAVLAAAGRALGTALSPIVAALNLDEVVLAGPVDLVEGPFLDAARATVQARTLSAVARGLEMSVADDSEDLVLRGASVLVLWEELRIS